MDNLTHSLFGLTLARTPMGKRGRGATVALLLASNAPDIDIISTVGGAAKYLQWHRGPTHGPFGVVGLGLLVAGIAWASARFWKGRDNDPPATLLSLWLLSMAGVICHILMDLPTSYGTRALSPIVQTWFAEDWMPIVDVYLWAILGAGLVFGSLSKASGGHTAGEMRARNATIALTLMFANYGLRAAVHHYAIVTAPQTFGAMLPVPCVDAVPSGSLIDWWPRERTEPAPSQRCLVEVAAIPDFLSPFRWRIVAQLSNGYEVRSVDLIADHLQSPSEVRLVSQHYPNIWTSVAQQAATARIAQVFLGFSRFPAARSFVDPNGLATVRWIDLRFDPGVAQQLRARAPNLFGAMVQVNAEGRIVAERLGS